MGYALPVSSSAEGNNEQLFLSSKRGSQGVGQYTQFVSIPAPAATRDAERQCICSAAVVTRSQKRLSGPLLDRIDIHVDVSRVNYEKLSAERQGEPSSAVRERVTAARVHSAERFIGGALSNDAMCSIGRLIPYCPNLC